MKLHIGCGSKQLPGYVHINLIKHEHIDYVHDIAKIDQLFLADSIDEIYACHVLEHFSRKEILNVFQCWTKVLKTGGRIRIAVPDFDAVVTHYMTHGDLSTVTGLLYGGQTTPYDYHMVTFNRPILTELLTHLGFSQVKLYEADSFLPKGFDDYSQAYLPHMDPNGILMYLNLTAVKEGTPDNSSTLSPTLKRFMRLP